MEQTNPLAELTHKRTLSALGPGGLRRERAGFDVRDVHHSHYGRICPIETPEGPNIGLIGSLATYAEINEYGFIETPYRRVIKELTARLRGPDRAASCGTTVEVDGKVIVKAGEEIDAGAGEDAAAYGATAMFRWCRCGIVRHHLPVGRRGGQLRRSPRPTPSLTSAVSSSATRSRSGDGDKFEFTRAREHRLHGRFAEADRRHPASLIPFLEHDDANRALMGSNMQRQAVPLLRPERPMVGTGMERQAAIDSGQVDRRGRHR